MVLSFFLSLLDGDTNRRRFEEIYLGYRKQMFTLARVYLQNDADAEDAVHDVFLRVASKCWDRVSRIENEMDLRNYLLRAVKNEALNILARRSRKELSMEDVPEPVGAGDATFDAVCAQAGEKRLLETIRKLPDIYRDALYCRYVLQFSVSETARAMGQSVSATKKRLQRGRQKLMALLRE